MQNKLLIASLVSLVTATAAAQPHPLRPTPVFEIDTVAADTHAKITSEHIWINGSWTFEDYRPKTPKTTSGKVSDEQLNALKAELMRAPWEHKLSQPPCAAPKIVTEYRVHSQLVYTTPACGDNLDEVSLSVLAYARGFADGAMGVGGSPAL